MTIKIPSKNIYSISNPKVRDNAIDNIFVKYNQIENKNEYNVLVQMDKQPVESLQYEDAQKNDYFVTYTLSGYFYNWGISYIVLEKGYATIKSLIPIEQNNSFIETLLTGKNGEGNPYINYRIIGRKINGQANCTAQRLGVTAGNYITYGEIEYHSRTSGEEGVITLPSDQEEITYEVVVQGENSSPSGTAKITPTYQNSTLTTATASVVQIDGKDYYEITINYPAWVRVTKLKGVKEQLNTQVTTNIPLSGEFVEYDPQYLEISFYGNTIGININQGVELFGNANGKTPFSIDSNELMQGRVNTAKYMTTLNKYNNGKETAIIRCNIDDYYDYDNNEKVISSSNWNLLDSDNYLELYNATYSDGNVEQVQADTATELRFQIQGYKNNEFLEDLNYKTLENNIPQKVVLSFTKKESFDQLRFKLNGKAQDTAILFDISALENNKTYSFSSYVTTKDNSEELYQGGIVFKELQLSYGLKLHPYEKFNLPMLFNIYDEVVPMKYLTTGTDVPLSTNPNGTPKKFIVIGQKITSKGAVFQELTLQEA